MRPINFKKFSTPAEYSFMIRYEEVNYTYDKLHYHKEFEIHYDIENWGTRFIGDSIQPFYPGDLVLVGPFLPHCWKSNKKYYKDPNLKAKVIIIQFLEDFIGDRFFDLPEMYSIKNFLDSAKYGVHFRGRDAIKIRGKIVETFEEEGYMKLLSMIELLGLMSESKGVEFLASPGFADSSNKYSNQEKISEILNFLILNYNDKNLKLNYIAENFHMHPSSFCKYLRKSTSKTFSQTLNEIRIGFACKKMINTDKSISEIAYDCGYLNVPYFNRVFKSIKGITPQVYKKIHVNENYYERK